ncbi:hypothetical protein [Serratia marcescens]|uniref:hypothetical protein n=1 Tax=Serratia marcescens TaxID=615 RepID=UPI001FD55E4A|nr:hypothetical protein [Serratia marcescens]
MDKQQEESRRQFEFEAGKALRLPTSIIELARNGDGYDHAFDSMSIMQPLNGWWHWWQASRASIVVELPKPHAHLIWIQAGYAPDDYWDDVEVSRSEKDKCCDGSDRYPVYAEHEIAESLRSIGLSIKGE